MYVCVFSESCWGKAMVAYTMPQQRKKEDVCMHVCHHGLSST